MGSEERGTWWSHKRLGSILRSSWVHTIDLTERTILGFWGASKLEIPETTCIRSQGTGKRALHHLLVGTSTRLSPSTITVDPIRIMNAPKPGIPFL